MAVDNASKIATLEALLASGMRSHTVDGQSVTYANRNDLIAEIERLKREDTENGYKTKRRIRSINLGGF